MLVLSVTLNNVIIQKMIECPLCQLMFWHETKETRKELTLSLKVLLWNRHQTVLLMLFKSLHPPTEVEERGTITVPPYQTRKLRLWEVCSLKPQKWLTRVLDHLHLPWWWFHDNSVNDLFGVLLNHWVTFNDEFLWNPSNLASETMLKSCGRWLEASLVSRQNGGVTNNTQWE